MHTAGGYSTSWRFPRAMVYPTSCLAMARCGTLARMARRPALTAAELRRLPAPYREAARLCSRWEGMRVGDGLTCRSALIGREVTMRLSRRDRPVRVTIVGCAVPRSDRKTKRCRADYVVARVRSDGSLGAPFVVDGGRVRNASRTPRPMHRLQDERLTTDRDAPYFYQQYAMIQRGNEADGLARMEGLDLPYPHRIGSSRCCPDHPENAIRLADELRWAIESDGVDRNIERRILSLGKHLRTKHKISVAVPESLSGNEDAAWRILIASDNWCGDGLIEWEQRAKQEAEERRARRGKGKRRSTTSADRKKRLAAVRASQGHTRSQVQRAIAKDARVRA